MHEGMIIPLAGIMLPMVLVPTIITMVHRLKRREWQHKERLRAIELGLAPTDFEPRVGGGTITAIGAGVPAASVLAALLTTLNFPESNPDYIEVIGIIWGCAVLISAVALISSSVLGVIILRQRKSAESFSAFATAKPAYEPDAYDVVSSRG
jgi:hypothetical protein